MIQNDVVSEVYNLFAQNHSPRGLDFRNKSASDRREYRNEK